MPTTIGTGDPHKPVFHPETPMEIRSPETLLKTGALQNAILNSAYFSSIATDEKGVIQIFNVGAENMLGYSAADVLNRATPADLSDPAELTDRAYALSLEFDTAIAAGFQALVYKAARGMEDIYPLTYIRKDGSRMSAIVSVTSLREGNGGIIGYLLIGTDNTERKKSEARQTLLDQQLAAEIHAHTEDLQRFRTAMDATGDGIFLINAQTLQYIEVNATACSMLGYSREELLQLGAVDTSQYSAARLHETYQSLMTGHKTEALFETTLRRNNGTLVEVEIYRQAQCYEGVWTIVSVVRDITERKSVQGEILRLNSELEGRVMRRTAQLQAANEDLAAFAYSVSHDLRSPLNTIDGFATLLERSLRPSVDDKARHYFERIHAGTRQMGILIEGMLKLANLSRTPLDLQVVDLSAICCQVKEELSARHPDDATQIHIQEALLVHGDPSLLLSVMNNLIGNAWKFSSRKSHAEIHVACETSPEGIKVYSVKDNGAGFDMAHAGKLFGTFERLHSSAEFAGTGLGLAIVQRIISRHGGKIWAHAVEDVGATFYFTLGAA